MPGGIVAVGVGTLIAWSTGPRAGRRAAGSRGAAPAGAGLRRSLRGARRRPRRRRISSVIIAMGLFNVLGSLQNIESAEAAGDSYDTRPSLTRQRHRQRRRGALRLGVPDHDLHRPSRVEGARRARRLLGAERRVRHADLPHGHAGVDRVGDADRRRHGDRAVDRHRDRRAGVPGDAARARAGGGRRPAARHRRLGRADGQERSARRRARRRGRTVQRVR